MAREALDGGRRLGPGPRHSVALQEGLARFVRSLPAGPGPSIDSEQLLITTVALCFFPIEHNDTMLAAMGLDAAGERFSVARKRHVVDVLERILARRLAARAAQPQDPHHSAQKTHPVAHCRECGTRRRRTHRGPRALQRSARTDHQPAPHR